MGARNKLFPASDNPDLERTREQLYDSFCRHLVCLSVRYGTLDEGGKSDGTTHLAHHTFFVASVGERWFLVTAGHVLKQLDAAVRSGRICVEYYYLADFFGERKTVTRPTPFPYETEPHFFIDDDTKGVDFGFIPLSELFKAGLKSNGIIPISDRQWTRSTEPDIHGYWVLGFPDDVNRPLNQPVRVGEDRKGIAAPVMVTAEKIEHLSEIPSSVPLAETESPRFVGRINTDIPFGIVGMSGGPIFGLAELPDSSPGYTIVALQSLWYAKSRIIVGCPVNIFGELLGRHVGCLPISQ